MEGCRCEYSSSGTFLVPFGPRGRPGSEEGKAAGVSRDGRCEQNGWAVTSSNTGSYWRWGV